MFFNKYDQSKYNSITFWIYQSKYDKHFFIELNGKNVPCNRFKELIYSKNN
jgi:hypothetical protein